MGDKYLIPDLKVYAQRLFEKAFPTQESVLIGDTVVEVYSSTPENDRGLRDIVLKTLVAQPRNLFRDAGFCAIATDVVPKFGFDFLGRMFDKLGDRNLYYCLSCPYYCGSSQFFNCCHNHRFERFNC